LYVVLPTGGAAGAAAAGADGADGEVGVACAGGGALGAAAGAATIGGVTATDTGALTTGGGAVPIVATGADTGVAPAGVETVAPAAVAPAAVVPTTATFGGPLDVATPAGVATALELFDSDAAAGASTTATAAVAGTIDPPDSPVAVRPPTAPAPTRDALRGRRSALSAAMRSAAGFVFAKPAV
jgi:hypothetical protein